MALKKRRDELEKYRQLLDETLKNLRKLYESKYNKINPVLAILGILTLAIGGVIIVYTASVDVFKHETLTFWGLVGVFIGLSIAFLGYIIAHRGFKGSWL